MEFRKSFDITPWDKKGKSAFGLKRHQAKWLGLSLIIFSILLMTPPGLPPEPTDAVNIIIAKYLVEWFSITSSSALVFSYTIVPWIMFLLGLYIYPYSTSKLFNGYINKLKRLVKRITKNPVLLIIMLIAGYYVFQIYEQILLSII